MNSAREPRVVAAAMAAVISGPHDTNGVAVAGDTVSVPHDADMTVQGFASRLRDNADVDDPVVDVLHVLRATLELASAALWWCGPAGVHRATPSAPSIIVDVNDRISR
jgi:hypothetical protein